MRSQSFTFLLSLFFLLLANHLSSQFVGSGSAMLSGQQEALPVVTAGSGSVDVEVTSANATEFNVVVSGSFSGLSSPVATNIGGGAHIHIGYPGRNGGVVLPLVVSLSADSLSGTFETTDNTFTVMAADFAGVDPGEVYVNIHTRENPGGELRGIIVPEDSEVYFTNLLGSNEVPSVMTRAAGALLLHYDEAEGILMVTGSFNDLSADLATDIGGGAHLHIGLPGSNGGVDLPLIATLDEDGGVFEAANNTFSLNADQEATLRAGRYYANVHSLAFPGGEIRGQVLPRADVLFRAHLSGSNEWPVVTTDGSGQVLAHLSGNTVSVIGSFADLESDVATAIAGGAHLHTAVAGTNGPVIQPLSLTLADDNRSGSFMLADNQYELTEAQRGIMLDRGIYVNVHTMEHNPGEIRGQVLPESQSVFTAFLNGNQQIPSITTTGRGMVKVEMMGNRLTATGSFLDLTSDLNTAIAGGAHLHAGYPGQGGPVIYPLTVEAGDEETRSGRFLPEGNTFQLTGGRADTLMHRFFYVNVHSLDHPGGEIRGSVLAEAESYFLAPLSGASEPVGVPTDATGLVAAEVVDSSVTLVGSFQGLDSDFAFNVAGGMHLHQAIAGSNGGILTPINTEVEEDNRSGEILADSNHIQLTQMQYGAMRDRLVYANLHTVDFGGGAIRGQMLPLAGSYFHTTFSGANEPSYVFTSAQGGLKMELIDTTLMVSGSVTMLDGDFDASVAGGAHLHMAPAGVNGPIDIPLVADPAEDLKSAVFTVDSNTFALSQRQVADLRNGQLYANIHTTMVRSGEARGQIRSELNLPPVATMILSPAENDSLGLEGDANQEFRVTYAATSDPDADTVIYIWQLATDESFTDVVFAANTGRDTFFSTTFGTVDALLDSNSVADGATATLYHRVLASDGSNFRPSDGLSVRLTRGQLVGVTDFRPLGFAARSFPNPGQRGGAITLEVKTQEAFTGRLLLYSPLGQLQQDRLINVGIGTARFPINTSDLAAGHYFVTLRNRDGRLVHTERLLIH